MATSTARTRRRRRIGRGRRGTRTFLLRIRLGFFLLGCRFRRTFRFPAALHDRGRLAGDRWDSAIRRQDPRFLSQRL